MNAWHPNARLRAGLTRSSLSDVRAAISISVAMVVATISGCGSSEPSPKVAPTSAAAEPKKPRCPKGADEMPSDAKEKMAGMQGEVRRCWALGTGKSASTVKVEVTVTESGQVRRAKVIGDGDPSAVQCMVKSLRTAHFAAFCGDDIDIAWTYALQ